MKVNGFETDYISHISENLDGNLILGVNKTLLKLALDIDFEDVKEVQHENITYQVRPRDIATTRQHGIEIWYFDIIFLKKSE